MTLIPIIVTPSHEIITLIPVNMTSNHRIATVITSNMTPSHEIMNQNNEFWRCKTLRNVSLSVVAFTKY